MPTHRRPGPGHGPIPEDPGKLRGRTGAKGQTGAQGQTGAVGAAGARGAPGRDLRPRRGLELPSARTLLWLGPLSIIGAVITVLLVSSAIPYRPFTIYSYVISPTTVCPGGPVKALVTREFNQSIDSLHLTETWTTVNVPGYGPDRPVQGNDSELPPQILVPHGVQTVPSPLLNQAPSMPGVYDVTILAQTSGKRFGFFPVIGSSVSTSTNTVTVTPCPAPSADSTPSPPRKGTP